MSGPTQAQLEKEISLTFAHNGRTAVIAIDRQKQSNAVTQLHYFRIAELLSDIAKMDDVVITVITGKGRFFSAGADFTTRPVETTDDDTMTKRKFYASTFLMNNMHNTYAWYSHPKILIGALNGPAVGLSAALIGHCDFVYAAPHTYLFVPFTSIGLNAEGAASKALVDRLGISRANEALLMSRKLEMEVLLSTGFVNKMIDGCGGDPKTGKGIDSDKFLGKVLDEVDDRLGPHLVKESLFAIKRQIRRPGRVDMDKASVDEVMGGLDVFIRDIPQKEFAKLASGEKRHKL